MSKKPDFSKVEFKPERKAPAAKASGKTWLTNENIAVKPYYTAADLAGMQHLDYAAGIPPFLRGPYSTMYVMRPWTVPDGCAMLA